MHIQDKNKFNKIYIENQNIQITEANTCYCPSCSTCGIRRGTVVSTLVIGHAKGKDQIVVTMEVLMLYFESGVLYHIYTFVDFEKE
jgi:hypothetical protein